MIRLGVVLHLALLSSASSLRRSAAPFTISSRPALNAKDIGRWPRNAGSRRQQHHGQTQQTNFVEAAPLPRTAILLVGLMSGWEEHIGYFLSGMVVPNKADVFIHTTGMPDGLRKRLGAVLKVAVDEEPPPMRRIHIQFWHLEKAFALMSKHEAEEGLQYDIVVRARSDIVPAPPSLLDLSEWRQDVGRDDKLHMMSDMIFWGGRGAMAKVAKFSSSIPSYYVSMYPDPMQRPIAVMRLIDSLKRDPWVNRPNGTDEPWTLYQKLLTLPYPDMGKVGAVENLWEAVEQGVLFWPPKDGVVSKVHCGDICTERDYRRAFPQSEKDLLHFVLINDLTICDVGASMRKLLVKSTLMERKLSSDCTSALHQ